MYCGHPRLCVCMCVCLPVCVSVCLCAAACLHYCTDPDVTWGSGRGCPLIVHHWADLQSVHGLRCYGNIACLYSLCAWLKLSSAFWNTWLGVRKSIWPVKNWWGAGVVILSGARCKWFAYGPADVTGTPSSLASLKSRLLLPFCCHRVVLESRSLNGCLSVL